jgi:hypothetical protein
MMGKCISTLKMTRRVIKVERIPMTVQRLQRSPRKSRLRVNLRFRVKIRSKC